MAVLELIRCGSLLLGENGAIIYKNAKAEEQLRAIRIPSAVGSDPRRNISLNALLKKSLAGRGREARRRAIRLPRRGKRPLVLRVLPLAAPARAAFMGARYLLLTFDPDDWPDFLPEVLQTVFRLTPSEAGIAIGLLSGSALSEIATARGVAVQTARMQLKSALLKTQTRRQAELVALLASLADGVEA